MPENILREGMGNNERPICNKCGRPAAKSADYKGKTYWRKLCSHCRRLAGEWAEPSQRDKLAKKLGLDTNQCSKCGQVFPFPCDIHHKDRNNRNNDLDNLEVLCPNCHRLFHWLLKQKS